MRVALALSALVAGFAGATAVAAPTPVRTCAERIEAGGAPLRFPARAPNRILAGPLALAGGFATTAAALGPRRENGRFGVKVGALVRAGRPVVLSVPRRFRGTLFTHYARSGDGEATVRLAPCSPSTRAFSYEGVVGRVTGFSGGFEVTRPGCFPLDVRVGARSYRVRLPLGRPCR